MRSPADIQLDLDAFHDLRRTAAISGIAEYSMDTGQGRQTVRRLTLSEINQTIRMLEAEALDASSTGNTYSARYTR